MYIIRKELNKLENGELVNVGYIRLKKCHSFGTVDHFMKGVSQDDLQNYSVTEYTADPDIYPANSNRVQIISGENWFLG